LRSRAGKPGQRDGDSFYRVTAEEKVQKKKTAEENLI
jgi:hypothetical protein